MELLTRREVEAMVRLGRSAIYRLMREGRFPLPIVVGARSVRWRSGEISQYLESRPRCRRATQPECAKRDPRGQVGGLDKRPGYYLRNWISADRNGRGSPV